MPCIVITDDAPVRKSLAYTGPPPPALRAEMRAMLVEAPTLRVTVWFDAPQTPTTSVGGGRRKEVRTIFEVAAQGVQRVS
jgi:hypothetical protein